MFTDKAPSDPQGTAYSAAPERERMWVGTQCCCPLVHALLPGQRHKRQYQWARRVINCCHVQFVEHAWLADICHNLMP